MAEVSLVKLPSNECYWTLLMLSQHWFRQWLGAIRQRTIAWASIDQDLCCHMVSLGHNESILLKYLTNSVSLRQEDLNHTSKNIKKMLCSTSVTSVCCDLNYIIKMYFKYHCEKSSFYVSLSRLSISLYLELISPAQPFIASQIPWPLRHLSGIEMAS